MNERLFFFVPILVLVASMTPVPAQTAYTAPAAPVSYCMPATNGSFVYDADYCEGRISRDYDSYYERGCDRCERGPFVREFHCDLFSCYWVREYGCPTCAFR